MKTEARALIGGILTIGFVIINVLVAVDLVTTTAYGVIIIWYAPFQAVVIGFYFGSKVIDGVNGRANNLEFEKLAGSIATIVNQLQQVVAIAIDNQAKIAEITKDSG
jgi:hypothetical protein